jgi:hypothetical protein
MENVDPGAEATGLGLDPGAEAEAMASRRIQGEGGTHAGIMMSLPGRVKDRAERRLASPK